MFMSIKSVCLSYLIILTFTLFNMPHLHGANAATCNKELSIYCGFSSPPDNFTELNGFLFFTADDGQRGVELWKTDGTLTGTVLVKDINKGVDSSEPSKFTTLNGSLYFTANDGVHGEELWKSDGTTAGTTLLKDIETGANSSRISHLTAYNGNLIISTSSGEIWRSNGSENGTALVTDVNTKLSSFVHAQGLLYFVTIEQWGRVFYTDGTIAGTRKIHERTRQNRSVFYNMVELGEYNGEFLFYTKAFHGDAIGFWTINKNAQLNHLWTFPTGYYDDGPGYPFTGLVKSANKSYIGIPVNQQNALLVLHSTARNNHATLIDRYNISYVDKFNTGVLVFYAAKHRPDRVSLWKSLGTDSSSAQIKDIFADTDKDAEFRPLGNYKSAYFFSLAGNQIWKTDGSQLGTVLIRQFADEIIGDSYIGNGMHGSHLFFSTLNSNKTYDLHSLHLSDNTPAYEDAEDFSTSRWTIVDNVPAGALVKNVFDPIKQSQVIQLHGDGKNNGFKLGDRPWKNGAWNNTIQTIIGLDLMSNDDFNLNISADTDDGERLLIYQPNDYNLGPHSVHTSQIRYGLGSEFKNGDWHTMKQDLESDLKLYEPKNNIKSVNGIVVRGSLSIDNISMHHHPEVVIEDAENGSTSAWVIHDFTPSGALLSNIYDVNKNSRVISFKSTNTKNAFRLGHHHSQISAWNNSAHKSMRWDMRFTDNYGINVTFNTLFGQRFLSYHADNTHRGIRGSRDNQFYIGLSRDSKNGQWQSVRRNLQTDLQVYEPDNHIITVDGMFVRGTGELDNITLGH